METLQAADIDAKMPDYVVRQPHSVAYVAWTTAKLITD